MSTLFARAGALVVAGLVFGLAGTGSPAVAETLQMQAAWPASQTLYDNFLMFADRVDKLSGGRLKIETLPAGTVVPPFELLDATNKRVVDGAHAWAGYWQGKNKTAILFTGGPGGTFGMDYIDYLGWMYEGGGLDLYQEFYRDVLKLNVIAIPILPSGPQAFGWFAKPIKTLDDLKGMKCRETGIAAEIFTRMGMSVVNMPGGEIMPAADRGVIDCAEWVGGVEDLRFGFQNIWKYHYTPGMHEPVTVGELLINGDAWNELDPNLQEIVKSAATETFIRWWASGKSRTPMRSRSSVEVAKAERRCAQGAPGEAWRAGSAYAGRDPDRVPQDLGRDRRRAGRAGSVLQESAGIEARLRERGRAGEAVHVPGLFLRRRLLLGQADELIFEL